MIEAIPAWFGLVLLCSIPSLFLSPGIGLGVSVLLSHLAPVWIKQQVAGIPFDVQTTVAILALLQYAVRRTKKLFSPLTFVDFAVAGMVVTHAISDVTHGEVAWIAALKSYGEWALPYVAGRYILRDGEDTRMLEWTAVAVLSVLSLGGIMECWFGLNPWEVVFGDRPVDGFARDASRWGLKRAYGPTMIPIFLGMISLILWPWGLVLAWQSKDKDETGRIIGWLAIILGTAGVCSSLSRGPILGLLVLVPCALAVWQVWLRWVLGVLAVGVTLFATLNPTAMLELLENAAGEFTVGRTVEVDGQELEFSGTRSRLILFKAYGPAIENAGLLGYGSAATSTFPMNIPHLPAEAKSVKRLRSIDQGYMLTWLRFGIVGELFFVLIFATAVVTGFWLSADRSEGILPGWLAATVLAVMVVLNTVWLASDFGVIALWTCGVIAGLACHRRDLRHV